MSSTSNNPPAVNQKYFPHIDGLRALAVLSVLLYHLEFDFISGGFTGVDVFFVISGYLITSHLRQSMAAERFTFTGFYARRVRRLLPALLATLLATLVAGFFILPAAGFEALAKEALFALFSGGNFLFWHQSGYFDSAAALKPLLHTWSLSVEEQFYLIWPLLLWLVASRSRALLLIVGLGIVSLLLAQYWLQWDPALVFFMMPFRIVEFSLGAVLVWLERDITIGPKARQGLSAAGMVLIVVSLLCIDKTMAFPGLWALPVCVGTALVIFSGGNTAVGRALSLAPVIYLGLISYSLYLVHWPLIVFYKYVNLFAFGLRDKGLLLLTALVLATAMYHLIEKPFRRKAGAFSLRNKPAACALSVMAVFTLVFSSHILAKDGWSWRFNYEQLSADAIEKGKSNRFKYLRSICSERGWDNCREPSPRKADNVLIMGDSHSVDGLNILYQAFPNHYYTSVSLGGCPPLVEEDMSVLGPSWPDRKKCVALNKQRLTKEFLSDYHAIAISVQFGWYKPEYLFNVLERIETLTDAPVIVFGNFVHLNKPMATLHNQGIDPRSRPELVTGFAEFEQALARGAKGRYVFISKRELFCAGEQISTCKLYFSDVPYSYDTNHLSLEASSFAAQQLRTLYPGGLEEMLAVQ